MEPRQDPVSTPGDDVRSSAHPTEVDLITNGVSWYLRSRLVVDPTRLTVATPKTVLGLVPVGKRRIDVGLDELRGARIGAWVRGDRLAVAVLLGAAVASGRLDGIPRILAAVGAVAFVLLGVAAALKVELKGGGAYRVPVCLAHLPRARRFIAEIESRAAVPENRSEDRST